MRFRFLLAVVLVIGGTASALGETPKAEQRKSDKRTVVPARGPEPQKPAEQKWVEDSINKFFEIPSDILNPQPNRR